VAITKENVAGLIYRATLALAPSADGTDGELIYGQWTSGFRAAGIFPFNRGKVTDADFAPADHFMRTAKQVREAKLLLAVKADAPAISPEKAAEVVDEVMQVETRTAAQLDKAIEYFARASSVKTSVVLTDLEVRAQAVREAETKQAKEEEAVAKKAARLVKKEATAKANAEKAAQVAERKAEREAKRIAADAAKAAREAAREAARAAKAVAPKQAAPAAAAVASHVSTSMAASASGSGIGTPAAPQKVTGKKRSAAESDLDTAEVPTRRAGKQRVY